VTEQHITVTNAKSGESVELCYQRLGDPEGPPLVLVMGLGAQMTAWPDEFVQGYADRYFDVIRFDNRDVGKRSSNKPRSITPNVWRR